jgi:hypothetical protein
VTCSFDQAKALAGETVAALAAAVSDEFALVGHETVEANGWLFFYNSKEFIETGSFSSSLVGNGPIFVDRNGVLKIFGSGENWDVAIGRATSG